MVLDASSDAENGDEDDDDSAKGPSDGDDDNNLPTKSNSDSGQLGRRLQISHLLKMVLQDAQTRLFFKAQSVIQSDIRHFIPKADDLAYPDVLVGMYFFMLRPKPK